MKELKDYNESYEKMINYLAQPMPKEIDLMIDRLDKLGILMTRSGQYLTDVSYKIDEVVDIECQTNIELLDKYSASTFNMMVKAKGKDWNRLKIGFDKCCSASVHQIDAIRSILSFEKAKMTLI
jgi:hypothetical protein